MQRYQFLVGVSVPALEEEVNRIVNDERSAKLNQVFYAPGTGFVGVVERLESAGVIQAKRIEKPGAPTTDARKSRKKSP